MTDTVFVQGPGGAIIEMDLPLHDAIAEQVEKGFARIVQNEAGDQYDEADRPVEVPTLRDSRPPLNARVGEWVSWAVFCGEDPEVAAAATKADLIEKYGQIEPGTGAHVAEEPTTDPAGTATPVDVESTIVVDPTAPIE